MNINKEKLKDILREHLEDAEALRLTVGFVAPASAFYDYDKVSEDILEYVKACGILRSTK